MEEKLFEFRYEQDEDFLKDYLKFAYFGMPARKVIIAVCILISACFIGFAVYATVRNPATAWLEWLLAAVFIALYAWMICFRYFRSVSMTKKRIAELYGDKPIFFEGYVTDTEIHFLNTANNAEETIALSTLAKVRESETLIVTNTASRMFHVFSKKGFTRGTPEEFVRFLREKGVR